MVFLFEHFVEKLKSCAKDKNIDIDNDFVSIRQFSLNMNFSLHKLTENKTDENRHLSKKGWAIIYAMKHGHYPTREDKISIGTLLNYIEGYNHPELAKEEWSNYAIRYITLWIVNNFFDLM